MKQENSKIKSDYNIFKELKLERKESIHSNMIVAIALHNQECRDLFLDMLENKLKSDVEDKNNNDTLGNLQKLREKINSENDRILINTEHKLKEEVNNEIRNRGRADIWIGNQDYKIESFRIIIENKIDANDQGHQLRRYYRYLMGNKRKNAGLFYLCLRDDKNRRKKIEISAKKFNNESLNSDTEYHILTYEHDIKKWLTDVLRLDKLDPGFKHAVEQYIEIVDLIIKQ